MPTSDDRPTPVPGAPPRVPDIQDFLGAPTRELEDWVWLWSGDHRFPIESHRGPLGRLLVFFKRLLRPLVKAPQNDLWDRQRVFNLILLSHLEELSGTTHHHGNVLDDHERRLQSVEEFHRTGFEAVMRHNDGLFTLVDQKLDRYLRESRVLWGRLGAALARVETQDAPAEKVAQAHEEIGYLELERFHRGTEKEIRQRISPYASYFAPGGKVLDLGCGRGEALAVFQEQGLQARGIDVSGEMVEACLKQGLDASQSDLFEALKGETEGGLDGVVSLHVIEHLTPTAIYRLVRLAWRVLKPGGVLVLETPNPLSLVVAARNFWLDPTHQRPVHPEGLEHWYKLAGFEPVERIDLRPFGSEDRLADVDLESLPEAAQQLGERVNELRDHLDGLLFGYQDYALIGTKP